jgi:hypothetical protein
MNGKLTVECDGFIYFLNSYICVILLKNTQTVFNLLLFCLQKRGISYLALRYYTVGRAVRGGELLSL